MPAIRLFDTALGREVAVEVDGRPSMYVCGITPYDATHMGHAASYVAFDLLNRAWRDAGHNVSYVQNVTDVDDPLLERATATGVDWQDLAASQIELFQTDMEALNVLAPDNYVGAVESIPLIVPEVERLVSLGLAYSVQGTNGEPDGDIYYDVEAAGKQSVSPDAWTLGSISGLAESEMLELFAERGGDPRQVRQAAGTGPAAVAGGTGRRAQLAGRQPRSRPARVAHRMHGDCAEVPALAVYCAGRRFRPDFPAP
jgi:L-cysteine:1D-myo-inositol 2-amino-2-deoxy-alpha-D-glucopyranoside ligase